MVKIIIVLLSALALGAASGELGFGSIRNIRYTPRVVGGETAANGEFPYQVSLQLRGLLGSGHFCGGSLLASNVVLTAGHCVTEVSIPPLTHLEIHAGLNHLNNEGANVQTSNVKKTVVHPNYQGGVNVNDLAIHILESPFTLNNFVKTIGLPDAGAVATGDATLSGWGSTSLTSSPSYPNDLQKAVLPVITIKQCDEAWGVGQSPLGPGNLCTGPLTGGLGACSGDSGGPLAQDGKVIGIVSWGSIPCGGVGNPSVYTDVGSFRAWIDQQVQSAKIYL